MFVFGKRQEKEKQWVEFEEEFAPYVKDIFRVALFLTRNPTDADDLVQDTILQALKYFYSYKKGTNIKAWVMTIMYRLHSKKLSKQRQSPDISRDRRCNFKYNCLYSAYFTNNF